MAIRRPIIHEISTDTYLINEFGLVNMYVLAGSQRSLVIDAGMGYCDLKAIVESLTDKPYDVVITHAHPDHAGMIHQFERVYLNEKEKPSLTWAANIIDFGLDEFERNNRLHVGNWEVWEVTEDMINRGNKDTEILPLHEGDVIDLGNRRITAYDCPGHTAGQMYFIDDFSRIAFTGDCCNYNNGTRFAASTFIRDLNKLLDGYARTYERIFTGHTTYCGTLDVKSHDINVVRNLIEAFRSLLRGDALLGERHMQLFPERPPFKVVLYGPVVQYPHENRSGPMVCPNYNPDMLWEAGEEHIIP
jgi:hydroxyacylglutathione hydrolase